MQSNQPDMRADDKNKKPVSDKSPALMLMRVLQGALIGGGAILPGVSGGVLAVVFGIYRPMMELLSHPFRALKKNLWLFIPIVIGVGIGFVGFAKLMALLFAEDSPYPISLFVGLILGTVPSLLKTARSQGRKPAADMTALILTFAGLLAFLIILEGTGSMNLTLTPVWALISGLIWGFSLIVPAGSESIREIIAGIDRGLLVSRFSGGSPSSSGDFSGVAKNSFLIENGQIGPAVSETMISGNLAGMFEKLRGISSERVQDGSTLMPYIAVDGITISGK